VKSKNKETIMKTLTKFAFSAILGSTALAFAATPAPTVGTARVDMPVATCPLMWIRNTTPKQAPYHVVKCTPEMMQKGDRACLEACAAATKKN
jgi:hypothetical protein